jgi:hypothetical protein
MKKSRLFVKRFWWVGMIMLALTACGGGGGDSDADVQQSYSLRLTNLTANQPFAPAAVVLHSPASELWAPGESAGSDLEMLAESGDPQPLLDAATARSDIVRAFGGSGVIAPGGSETFTLTLSGGTFSDDQPLALTVAAMLVNTNDAFAGVSGSVLPLLEVDQQHTWFLPAYDAGTEANSETAGTVPGPAAGGEGFASARDDVDRIAIHPGVISSQDGLADSALDGSHRWDNPVLMLELIRTQ